MISFQTTHYAVHKLSGVMTQEKMIFVSGLATERENVLFDTSHQKENLLTCHFLTFWSVQQNMIFQGFLDHLYLHVRPSNRVCNHCARHGTFALALIATNVSYLHSFNFLFDQIYSFLLLGRPKDIDCKVKITSLSMKKQINDEASGLWKNIDFVVLYLFQ